MDVLARAAQQARAEYNELQTRIASADKRLGEIAILQRHIGTYSKTRDIYSQYLRSKRNRDFYIQNEKAIADCEKAKVYFETLPYTKLPTIKELQAEYSILVGEKYKCDLARKGMHQHMIDLESAKKNAETILSIDQKFTTQVKRNQDSR